MAKKVLYTLKIPQLVGEEGEILLAIPADLVSEETAKKSSAKLLGGALRLLWKKEVYGIGLTFHIKSQWTFRCDRTLSEYTEEIASVNYLQLRFNAKTKQLDEISEECLNIPLKLEVIELDNYVYDYVMLSVPMRKIHVDLREDTEPENPYLPVYTEKTPEEGAPIDPRWQKLQQHLDKNSS